MNEDCKSREAIVLVDTGTVPIMAIKIQKLHILAIVSVLFSIVTSFQYKIKNNHYNSFRHSKIYPSHNIHSQFGRFTYRKLTNNDINDILDEDHTDKTPIKSSRALSLIETRSNNRQYSDSYIDPSKYQLPESVVLEIRGHLNRLVELSRSIQSNPDDGNDIDDIVEKMSQIITAQCALRYITSNPTFDYVIKSSTGFTDSENVELDDTLDDSIHTPVNGNEVVFSCPISSNNICWGTLTLTCIDPMSCDMTIIANQKDPHTSTTNNYNKEIIQSLCDYCAANIASVLTTEMKRTQSQHIQVNIYHMHFILNYFSYL